MKIITKGNCRDCDTCKFQDGPFDDSSPCWECTEEYSNYIKESAQEIKLRRIEPADERTPRQKFFEWCQLRGDELTEMIQDVDYEIMDDLWIEIAVILGLDGDGQHFVDCNTCKFLNMKKADDGPCLHCDGGMGCKYKRA